MHAARASSPTMSRSNARRKEARRRSLLVKLWRSRHPHDGSWVAESTRPANEPYVPTLAEFSFRQQLPAMAVDSMAPSSASEGIDSGPNSSNSSSDSEDSGSDGSYSFSNIITSTLFIRSHVDSDLMPSLITVSNSSASHASTTLAGPVVRAFDPADPIAVVRSVVVDDLVMSLWHCHLAGGPIPAVNRDHFVPVMDGDRIVFRLRTPQARALRFMVDITCNILLVASNNHDAWTRVNLDEAGVVMPSIVLFRQALITFESRLFLTRDHGMDFVHDVYQSMEHGFASQWNFAAVVEMSRHEFFNRIARYFAPGRFTGLEAYMSNQLIREEIDTACARLVSPIAEQIWVSTRAGNTDITVWPLARNHPVHAVNRALPTCVPRYTREDDSSALSGIVDRLRSMGL
ncbi:hypothetical protein B0H12DRAFT_1078802 [Mycena haematopus]|nr:hypothetical protein B0H12DRAFT_1078802 [Mycena haematopus]